MIDFMPITTDKTNAAANPENTWLSNFLLLLRLSNKSETDHFNMFDAPIRPQATDYKKNRVLS